MDEHSGLPRIALLVSDADVLSDLEGILRENYTSLLIITDRRKLAEFPMSFVVILDSIQELSLLSEMPMDHEHRLIVVTPEKDSELVSAAFDVGAREFLTYPFHPEEVIAKVEKYLDIFRKD